MLAKNQIRIQLRQAQKAALHSGDETVHQLRIVIKRLRAEILLARPQNPKLCRELDLSLKNIAQGLSEWRNLQIFYEKGPRYAPISPALLSVPHRLIHDCSVRLTALRPQLFSLAPKINSWQDLRKAYRKYCQAEEKALQKHRAEDFHAWRKKVKIFVYQADLLPAKAQKENTKFLKGAADLSETLGDLHDLELILGKLSKRKIFTIKVKKRLQRKIVKLQKRALHQGRRLRRSPSAARIS